MVPLVLSQAQSRLLHSHQLLFRLRISMSVVLSLLVETYLEVLLGGDEVLPKHVFLQRSPFQPRILRLNLLCGEDLVRNGKMGNGKPLLQIIETYCQYG